MIVKEKGSNELLPFSKGLTLPTQIAYVLATVQWETAGTFKPVREAYYIPKAEEWSAETFFGNFCQKNVNRQNELARNSSGWQVNEEYSLIQAATGIDRTTVSVVFFILFWLTGGGGC